jgi:hypothetical protein
MQSLLNSMELSIKQAEKSQSRNKEAVHQGIGVQVMQLL